jgi:hypothetical protein
MLIPLLSFLGIYLVLAIGGLLGFPVCLSLLGSMADLVVERPYTARGFAPRLVETRGSWSVRFFLGRLRLESDLF